jgi:hypothetical protein
MLRLRPVGITTRRNTVTDTLVAGRIRCADYISAHQPGSQSTTCTFRVLHSTESKSRQHFSTSNVLHTLIAVLPLNRNFNQNYTIFNSGLIPKYIRILVLTILNMAK